MQRVVVAVAPVGLLVVCEDRAAVVCDQRTHYVEGVAVAGVFYGAVAMSVLVEGVPGGVVRERELHGREMAGPNAPLQDSACEVLGGDPAGECWTKKLM